MINLIVPGRIQAKQRPRFTKFGVYTPEETKRYESLIKCLYFEKYGIKKIEKGPVKVKIFAYFKIPTTASEKTKQKLLGSFVIKKPDLDNIAKIVLDGLNKVAYYDDNQISELYIQKTYSTEEYLQVIISATESYPNIALD